MPAALMRRYYDRIFPAQLMCRWLSYGSQHEDNAAAKLLPHREFSFTTGDDVYIRYLSYEDAAGLKKVCGEKTHVLARTARNSHVQCSTVFWCGAAADARRTS